MQWNGRERKSTNSTQMHKIFLRSTMKTDSKDNKEECSFQLHKTHESRLYPKVKVTTGIRSYK